MDSKRFMKGPVNAHNQVMHHILGTKRCLKRQNSSKSDKTAFSLPKPKDTVRQKSTCIQNSKLFMKIVLCSQQSKLCCELKETMENVKLDDLIEQNNKVKSSEQHFIHKHWILHLMHFKYRLKYTFKAT